MQFLILLIMYLLPTQHQADTYYVTYIKGTVRLANSEKVIKPGDAISMTPTLAFRFGSLKDVVAVVSPTKGRCEITPVKVENKNGSEIWGLVKDNLVPGKQHTSLSTRSGMLNNFLDMEKFFSSQKILITEQRTFPISKNFSTNSDQEFFFIRYSFQGEEINKRLKFLPIKNSNDTLQLILDRSILEIDGQPIENNQISEWKLYYFNELKNESTQITPVNLVFSKHEELIKEIEILRQSLEVLYQSNPDRDKLIRADIHSHLASYYGNIETSLLASLSSIK